MADRPATRAERVAPHLGVPMTRAGLESVPADVLVKAAAELSVVVAANDDPALLMMPVIDGGLLRVGPEAAVADGSASSVPLLIGTTRDESAFFAVGDPGLSSLDHGGLRRWTRRLTPDATAADRLVERVSEARAGRGEPVTPRDLWVAIATEYVFRLPTIRLADAHARAARPGVGTYGYLFTWESPVFGGSLGSCHALDIPFVFGTVHNPAVQTFSGGGDDALALSELMRRAWTGFARSGSPGSWPRWDPGSRPTTVLGPWPGQEGLEHRVDRPRDDELEAMATLVAARPQR
jgi:para-nitrobenzyl esterase